MNIEDRIRVAEERFFLEEVRDPRFLIMTYDALAELSDETDMDPLEPNTSYMGLIICLTEHPNIIDFELA
jgi:hypothetical protein